MWPSAPEIPARALAEAEQRLDAEPGDFDALDLVATAALDLGDGGSAALALEQLLRSRPDDVQVWARLARARYLIVDWQGALWAADRAIAGISGESTNVALAHHVRACIGIRTGEPTAPHDQQRAAQLDPLRFPLPAALPDSTWQSCVAEATRQVAEPVQAFLEGVPVQEASWPEADVVLAHLPLASPETGAMAEGEPLRSDPWSTPPVAILLFRDNLCWPPAEPSVVVERIARALTDVAVAWTGLDLDTEDDADDVSVPDDDG